MLSQSKILLDQSDTARFIRAALNALGSDHTQANRVADGLVYASVRGIDSHGIRLLPHYFEGLKHGRINKSPKLVFQRNSPTGGVMDADHAFGLHSGLEAMGESIRLAEESGCGFVSVGRSSHCGAMGFFTQAAAKEDMLGLAFTHTTSNMRSPQSNRPFFGSNPICFAAPMDGEDPFCYDAATTQWSKNKINATFKADEQLPYNIAADASGEVTLDPEKVFQLLPMGDYKGFGLAMMVEILCSLLSGMPYGNQVSKMFGSPMNERRNLGHFYGAIRIDQFQDPDTFKQRLTSMANDIRSEPQRNPETPNQIPGDPEKAAIIIRSKTGLPLSDEEHHEFLDIAQELGIAPPTQVESVK